MDQTIAMMAIIAYGIVVVIVVILTVSLIAQVLLERTRSGSRWGRKAGSGDRSERLQVTGFTPAGRTYFIAKDLFTQMVTLGIVPADDDFARERCARACMDLRLAQDLIKHAGYDVAVKVVTKDEAAAMMDKAILWTKAQEAGDPAT